MDAKVVGHELFYRVQKVWGITAGSVEEIKRYRQMGAQMVPWGGDFTLMNVLKTCSEELDQVPGA